MLQWEPRFSITGVKQQHAFLFREADQGTSIRQGKDSPEKAQAVHGDRDISESEHNTKNVQTCLQ